MSKTIPIAIGMTTTENVYVNSTRLAAKRV